MPRSLLRGCFTEGSVKRSRLSCVTLYKNQAVVLPLNSKLIPQQIIFYRAPKRFRGLIGDLRKTKIILLEQGSNALDQRTKKRDGQRRFLVFRWDITRKCRSSSFS